jgi:hypothetical protein
LNLKTLFQNLKTVYAASLKLVLAYMAQDLFFNLQQIVFVQPKHYLRTAMVAALLPPPSV